MPDNLEGKPEGWCDGFRRSRWVKTFRCRLRLGVVFASALGFGVRASASVMSIKHGTPKSVKEIVCTIAAEDESGRQVSHPRRSPPPVHPPPRVRPRLDERLLTRRYSSSTLPFSRYRVKPASKAARWATAFGPSEGESTRIAVDDSSVLASLDPLTSISNDCWCSPPCVFSG